MAEKYQYEIEVNKDINNNKNIPSRLCIYAMELKEKIEKINMKEGDENAVL